MSSKVCMVKTQVAKIKRNPLYNLLNLVYNIRILYRRFDYDSEGDEGFTMIFNVPAIDIKGLNLGIFSARFLYLFLL